MPTRLLCACPLPPAVADRARREFDAILSQDDLLDTATIAATLRREPGIAALLVSSRNKLAAEALHAMPTTLRLVATCSVGFEHVDLAAAARLGLVVTNTPDVLTDATADLAMLLVLAACRRAREYLAIMERGWREPFGLGDVLGTDLRGKTLGIVGMGRIGQAVAHRARAFGMRIAYHNRSRLPAALEQGACFHANADDLLREARVLSLHAPAGGTMSGFLNARTIGLLPRGAVVVNTARGQLVDEDALLAALACGHVAAAGLDVFHGEPAYDLRFRDLPNVFFTPHMGSATVEARDAMGNRALDNVAAVLAGRAPVDPVVARAAP